MLIRAIATLLLGLCCAAAATAAGTFVPAPARVDMVHDAQRNRVYISSGGQVLRYATKYDVFRAPIVLGGSLGGMDISPDGRTLVVADRTGMTGTFDGQGSIWLWLVDLDTLEARKVSVKPGYGESGMYTAVYGGDGMIYTSSSFSGSGWVSFRRLDPATGQWTTLVDVRQDTMLSASGDGNTIAFAEANISDGRWGVYRIPTGQLVQRQWYTDGTSWFNYEIGASHDGLQTLLPTYGGGMVYDAAYQKIQTIGTYAGAQPVGIAYHPVEPLFYAPIATTSELRAYDATSFAQVGSWDVGKPFSHPGNWAFQAGRTRISRDGSLLMVSVTDGVQLIRQYAPLRAQPIRVEVPPGASVSVELQGSIGNDRPLEYSLPRPPERGSASLLGRVLTYVAPAGPPAVLRLPYRVRYGRALAEAEVEITITGPGNDPPVAVDDVAEYRNATSILIPVLANDSDPDGDALQLVGLSGPAGGSAAIEGSQVRYVPKAGVNHEVFGYTISDGQGHTANATITVSKGSRINATATRPLRRRAGPVPPRGR
jgi:hypothetical protein